MTARPTPAVADATVRAHLTRPLDPADRAAIETCHRQFGPVVTALLLEPAVQR